MLMWGTRDSVLPVGHALKAHEAMPGSRLEIFEGAGHFPFRTDPARFVREIEDFCETTLPSTWSVEQWRMLLRNGRAAAHFDDPVGLGEEFMAESERSAT